MGITFCAVKSPFKLQGYLEWLLPKRMVDYSRPFTDDQVIGVTLTYLTKVWKCSDRYLYHQRLEGTLGKGAAAIT